jgi:hypothetical protein
MSSTVIQLNQEMEKKKLDYIIKKFETNAKIIQYVAV